jgi:hypothetical protein
MQRGTTRRIKQVAVMLFALPFVEVETLAASGCCYGENAPPHGRYGCIHQHGC